MPWKVVSEDGRFKVYKLGPDNKPTGKPVGTHTEKPKADAQMRALYASEKKPKEVEIPGLPEHSDVEVSYYPAKVVPDEEEIARREESKEAKDYYGNPVEVTLVESSCGPLSFADLQAEEAAREAAYEMYELTDQFQRISRNIMNGPVEDKATALVALANEFASLAGEKVKEEVADKAASIAQQIAGDNQPKKEQPANEELTETDPAEKSLFIWKEADTYRWLAAYSNNRRDEDNPPEIISSASHKEFDEALNNKEWPMPELWVWHVPLPVGQTLFHAYDESKGFPIGGGVFNKGFEWVAEGLVQAGWDGVSHGMPSEWIQRDKEDPTVIIRHRTKEVSILPNWAAANKLAFTIISKENSMADQTKDLPQHKRQELVAAFGEDKAKLFESALADKAKAADEAQIEQKEAGEKATVPTTADVVKGLEFIVEQLNALNDKYEARFKALEAATVKEEDQFDIVAQLRAKSVIGNPAARVHGNSTLAKDAPKETQPETPTVAATGGVPIGLVDGLFQLNQGWYNRGGEQR